MGFKITTVPHGTSPFQQDSPNVRRTASETSDVKVVTVQDGDAASAEDGTGRQEEQARKFGWL